MTAAETLAESDQLARLWNGYARTVYGSYSALNAALAKAVSESELLLDFVRRQPRHAHDPNMLLAAIQFLVLGGVDHPVALLYEGDVDPGTTTDLGVQLESFCARFDADLSRILAARRIQTNEVGRSSGLALGLACAARVLGEPLALLDVGASAGLNLLLDQYRLRFSTGQEVGPSSSPVQIECRVEPAGTPLPQRLPAIDRRMGLDRDPVDLADPDNVRWLLACIWPGTGRHDRAAAAMKLAGRTPPHVARGDMVADLRPMIRRLRPGAVVVVNSWSFSYLDADKRLAYEGALRDAGRDGPVAWIYCDTAEATSLFSPSEPPPDVSDIPSVLGLAVFDGDDVESHCLGYMHSHGRWVKWLDQSMTPEFG